jgi:hypothetical protein
MSCIPFKITQVIVLGLSVAMLIQSGYLWITTFVNDIVVFNYLLREWGIALACLTLVCGALGITDALTAMLRKGQVARILCIPHIVVVAATLICQIVGYSLSISWWVSYFSGCGNQCVFDQTAAFTRLGVSFFFFTLFNTANLIFAIIFATRSLAGDDDTLLKGRE